MKTPNQDKLRRNVRGSIRAAKTWPQNHNDNNGESKTWDISNAGRIEM